MIKFRGTRKELGEFYGNRLREFHHDFCRQIDEELLETQLKIYEKYYPELIIERTAAAEVIGLDPSFLLYEDLASFVKTWQRRAATHKNLDDTSLDSTDKKAESSDKLVKPREHGCTIFALNENGKTYVGRNYDWLSNARNFFEQYEFDLSGSYRYFAFSDEAVWDRHTSKNNRKMYTEDTVNEHGLYIGITFANIKQWNYGLCPSHFLRLIAEKCRTTRQALNIFAKVPCAEPKNFLIADAKGDIAIVEHAAKSYEIIRPENLELTTTEKLPISSTRGRTKQINLEQHTHLGKLAVHTNHCLSPRLTPQDQARQTLKTNSFIRFAETNYLVKNQLPNFQFTDIWRILRNSHYVYNDETIWSLALELSEQRFNIYCDTAEGQKQKKFGFKPNETE